MDPTSYTTLSAAAPAPGQAPLVYFRPAAIEDLEAVYQLEVASYPEDEAATHEKLKFRILNAPYAFLVAVTPSGGAAAGSEGGEAQPAPVGERIVGFTCGTCSTEDKLTHSSMSTHEAGGQLLCIHSVVTEASLRRKGIATRMLKAYLKYVQAGCEGLKAVRLICKGNLIKLYEGAGFSLVGPSDVVHGKDPWYEMAFELADDDS